MSTAADRWSAYSDLDADRRRRLAARGRHAAEPARRVQRDDGRPRRAAVRDPGVLLPGHGDRRRHRRARGVLPARQRHPRARRRDLRRRRHVLRHRADVRPGARRAPPTAPTASSRDDLPAANGVTMDHARRRLFVDEFRPGGRLMELDPAGVERAARASSRTSPGRTPRRWAPTGGCGSRRCSPTRCGATTSTPARAAWPSTTWPGRRRSSSTRRAGSSCRRRLPGGSPPSTSRPASARRWPRCRSASTTSRVGRRTTGSSSSHYVDGRVAEETGGRTRMLSRARAARPARPGRRRRRHDPVRRRPQRRRRARRRAPSGRIRLLVDLPTLAVGVAAVRRRAGGARRRAARCCCTRGGGEPAVLASGLTDPTCLRADGDRLLVTERRRRAGRRRRRRRHGRRRSSRGCLGRGVGRRARRRVRRQRRHDRRARRRDGGERRTIDGFGDAQGVAVVGDARSSSPTPARHELVAVDVGRRPPRGGRHRRADRPARGRRRARGVQPRWPPTAPAASSSGATATARSAASTWT